MSKEKILDKIKKILALSSNNPSEAEAAHAATIAKEMLDKYNFSMLDLETNQNDDIEECSLYFGIGKEESWIIQLMKTLTYHFDCKCHYEDLSFFEKGKIKWSIVGYQTDLEIFEYTYIYLRRMIEKMSANIRKLNPKITKKYLISYLYGIVIEIDNNLYKERKEKEKHMNSENTKSNELIETKKNAVYGWCDKNLNLSKSKQRNTALDHYGYNHGINDGKTITIRQAVKGDKSKQNIIGG